jgi:hypothetical protein
MWVIFLLGRLSPVRFSGRAVIAGKFVITEFWGGFSIYVSRGDYNAVRNGKPKSRAGRVRPIVAVWRCGGVAVWRCGGVAVWRRGRQDAALNRKKRKHGRLRFFLLLGPRLRSGAAPPPLSRKRTGLRPERNVVKRREQTPPFCF